MNQAFKDAGAKILANLVELLTSKTTWIVLAGIVADAYQNGKLTAASLVLLAAKAIQQGAADWGKTAALSTTTTTATPSAITAVTAATPPEPPAPK